MNNYLARADLMNNRVWISPALVHTTEPVTSVPSVHCHVNTATLVIITSTLSLSHV
ncbi:hypothetical protein J6590_083844 [Homalodisca vitripennis]|nr:hypothetical protein J6590_083844 [Homalodisca vitripennis]